MNGNFHEQSAADRLSAPSYKMNSLFLYHTPLYLDLRDQLTHWLLVSKQLVPSRRYLLQWNLLRGEILHSSTFRNLNLSIFQGSLNQSNCLGIFSNVVRHNETLDLQSADNNLEPTSDSRLRCIVVARNNSQAITVPYLATLFNAKLKISPPTLSKYTST